MAHAQMIGPEAEALAREPDMLLGDDEAWLGRRAGPGDGLLVARRDPPRAEAEQAHSARLDSIGLMAGALAHELAQPLTSAGNAVAASLALLSREGDADIDSAREALELARGSVERANELLRRVRAFIAKGQPHRQRHKLATIVADAAVLMLPEARLAGVEMRFELDRHARWVEADAIQVQQVLMTLVRQAIGGMADASDRRIRITTACHLDEIEIRVEDGGPRPRIAPEALFARGATSGAEPGPGLGVCRAIVQAHGGRLRADRSPAGGTFFAFTLPAAPEPADAPNDLSPQG